MNKLKPVTKQKIIKAKSKSTSKEDPLKIVREFQRKYRNLGLGDNSNGIDYKWQANPSSSTELKQRNYFEDSQSAL